MSGLLFLFNILKGVFKMEEYYDVEQVIEVVKMLSHSQGTYGRMLEQILYLRENKPDAFDEFSRIIESQHFKDPVDIILFFEQ